MEPGAFVDRLQRLDGADELGELAALDLHDDLSLDRIASVLLQRFHRQNDVQSLALVFEVTRRRLAEIATQVTAKFALAIDPDDLVASFMTRLFTDLRRPQPVVRRFLGLAHTSMRNDALNQLRQHTRSVRRMLLFQEGLPAPADPALQASEREESRAWTRAGVTMLAVVWECFHGLRERDRRVLLARELERMSYADVAAALTLPENQVGMVIQRARQRLAKRIARALSAGEEGPS